MNYPIFDGKEPTKKELIAGYLMAGIPLFFGFYMAVWGFGQIADKKAQTSDNLIKGCMYYDGYSKDKHKYYSYYFLIEKKLIVGSHLFRGKFFLILKIVNF